MVDTTGITARYDTTEYTGTGVTNDPVYFLYTPNPKGHDVGGNITATYNGIDKMNYRWYKFNKVTNKFDNLIYTEDSVIQSIYSLAVFDTGGYKVMVQNSTVTDSMFAWVFFNKLSISIPYVIESDCEFMKLKTKLDMGTIFPYHNRFDNMSILYKKNESDSVTIKWSASESYKHKIPEAVEPTLIPPPTEPVKYTITVTDKFGKSSKSYIEIDEDEPVDKLGYPYLRAVKADFEASRALTDSLNNETDTTGQAPLNVQFINKSKNAELYRWVFYNQVDRKNDRYNADTVLYTYNTVTPTDSITYTFPASYDVLLGAYGPIYTNALGDEYRCYNEMLKQKHIEVDSVFLPQFMNVFTPGNGDEINDRFYFVDYPSPGKDNPDFKRPRSISSFSIKIYSRWGTKVYFYEGSADDWQGWDGTSGITNSTVKTGVYYYQAIFEGYDGSYHQERRGFIHVFR